MAVAVAVATCSCAGCRSGLEPFTVEHFRVWALDLELDNGEAWVVEDYFLAYVDDVFSGLAVAWLVVPEGNAKTTNLAGLALYHCEHRVAAMVPWAASARDQAEIGYVQAEGFVLRSARLSALFVCQAGYRKIKHRSNRSKIQIYAADAGVGDGVIPTFAIVDEAHRHKNLALIRTWRGKLQKRGGQMLVISTAGEPGSEFEETRERMRVAATELERDDCFVRAAGRGYVLHEWAVPEDGDVEDLDLVARANPASFVTEESLREKREDPAMTLPHWRRFSCGLPTRPVSAAVTEAAWFAAATAEEIPEGQPVWVGVDLGFIYDTTAIVPLWMRDPEFRLFGKARILVPPGSGVQLDFRLIQDAFREINARNPVHTVVMDPHHGELLAQWLEEEFECVVVARQQSLPLQALDYSRFMEALREGWLHHDGSADFARHVLNAVARELPRGDLVFERPHESRTNIHQQARRVIDALDAAAMVHCVACDRVEAAPLIAFSFA